ncbi:L-rhamnose mutarotase [Janthinobacterium lividum]|uniref:L-rhamnose mutarotase n=1 Tax=Janthinobacterium lividum TaxID=29581 RepID=UPI00140CDE7C|nr:L-rhamnose mutarotase [Janthinobacterium lividum]NHQ89211.1 L-rhamnose mutarotase [Janthinobacterium lividum]
MEHIAFRMQLKPGPAIAAEYQRRHDAIWPELASLLHDSGVRDYSIFLDAGTGALFAVLRRIDGHAMEALPQHPVMRRWWDYMADLMDTRPDASPVVVPLARVFHLA